MNDLKNQIKILLLLVLFVLLVIPGFVGAANKEFHRYYFMEGTFYKYPAATVEEYFDYSLGLSYDDFPSVDWKELNKNVIRILAERKAQEKDHEEKEINEDTAQNSQDSSGSKTNTSNEQVNNQDSIQDSSEDKPSYNQEFEQEVIRLTNLEREKYGLAPLKLDSELAQVARKKSIDMNEDNYFAHDSPTYGSPFDMMESFGINYYAAGENIAKGQTSPKEVVAAWMASEGHRENILHTDYTHIGVGFVEGENYYWTQQFIKRLDDTVNQASFEQTVVDLTNQERAKHGLTPLAVDTKLTESARAKSIDMAEHGYFDHTSPTYGSPFDMMETFGISYQTAGENIARGQFTPEEVVEAWMNSEGHRANILNEDYTHIGVGFVTEDILWTQQFIGR
jgi:uncharacterized YkwD family protein